jgi:D-threo-aldose 1-dehydrogenase
VIASRLTISPTRLGYGCSSLMGGISRRESLRLLDTAFDAGIRHFDTAPSYGYGEAEGVLGEALRGKRDKVTIATKFGIRPPQHRNLLGAARAVLRPLVGRLPGLKSRLARAAGALKARPSFTAAALRTSLESSLLELRTDYIDVFLLHEAVAADLSDDLFEELQRCVRQGKIRSFGIGSEAPAISAIYANDRRFCQVLQFEWSVLSAERPAYPGSFLVTHRSLSDNLARLRRWLENHPHMLRSWSRELGQDLSRVGALAQLMLGAAVDANVDGITLFSSRNPANIRANAQAVLANPDLHAARTLAALVARDVQQPRAQAPSATAA